MPKLFKQFTYFEMYAVFLLGVMVALIPQFLHNGFYFYDDMQHEYIPAFLNIGRCLRIGELPILSLGNWYGGYYLGEYQYALYNPISLLTYLILPSISTYAWQSAALAAFYLGLLGAGCFALARDYGVGRGAAWLVALICAGNNFISYWLASSWFPCLIGIVWLIWVWHYLSCLQKENSLKNWLLTLAFSYLTFTAGFPQIILVFGVLVVLLFSVETRSLRFWQSAFSAFTIAGLCSLPSLLPLISISEVANRIDYSFHRNFMIFNLFDEVNFSTLFHLGHMIGSVRNSFLDATNDQLIMFPIFFCAWFIAPLLPLLDWQRIDWRDKKIGTLLMFVLVMLLATQGPEQIGPIQQPMRYLPLMQIALIILFGRFAIQFRVSHWRDWLLPVHSKYLSLSVGIIALGAIMSLQKDPLDFSLIAMGLLITIFSWLTFIFANSFSKNMGLSALAVTSLLMFTVTHSVFSVNRNLVDWHIPPTRIEVDKPVSNPMPEAYSLLLGGLGNVGDEHRVNEFQTGYLPMEAGRVTIGGYSPVGHKALALGLCMSMYGATCDSAPDKIFMNDPETHANMLDLMRVNRLIVMKGQFSKLLQPHLTAEWQRKFDGVYTERYVRNLPNANLPGTVSWISPRTEVESIEPPQPLRESVQINRSHTTPDDQIVFARLLWPGYRAYFNDTPIPVHAQEGIFTSVYLPTTPESGVLRLEFVPAYSMVSAVAVVLAALLFTIILINRRRFFVAATV